MNWKFWKMSHDMPAHAAAAADDSASPAGSDPTTESPTPPEALTGEQIAELQVLANQGLEAQERYLRLYADFENFKKRAARERDEVRRAAIEGMISRLLPVLDTFDMAMVAAQQSGTNLATLKAGVLMIQGQLRGVFVEQGLEELVTEGKEFDPALHDAVSQTESTSVPEGRILQELRKGYRLKDRLLRPATVVVAKAPSIPGDGADPDGSAESTAA